jgi:hypothetical protein
MFCTGFIVSFANLSAKAQNRTGNGGGRIVRLFDFAEKAAAEAVFAGATCTTLRSE